MFTVRVIEKDNHQYWRNFSIMLGAIRHYFCCIRSVIGLENHAFLPKQSRARPNTNHDWVTRVFPLILVYELNLCYKYTRLYVEQPA